MFASLVAALLAALLQLPTTSHPVAPPAVRSHSASSTPTGGGHPGTVLTPPPAAASTVPAPDDVAQQLPGETDGRAIDCADGVHAGVMVDGEVTGCP